MIAFIINGRRATITAWMRFGSCFAGFLLFLSLSVGFLAYGIPVTVLAIYPPIAISEAVNIYFTMIDAGSAWKRDQTVRAHVSINS